MRQEKLAVLGQLAGSVGHELRNPLAVITNAIYYLRLILTQANPTVIEYLTAIETHIKEADKIVVDLLDLSRTRTIKSAPVPIADLIKVVLQRHPPPAPITVTSDIPADLPLLLVDAQQIRQVLTNLITKCLPSYASWRTPLLNC